MAELQLTAVPRGGSFTRICHCLCCSQGAAQEIHARNLAHCSSWRHGRPSLAYRKKCVHASCRMMSMRTPHQSCTHGNTPMSTSKRVSASDLRTPVVESTLLHSIFLPSTSCSSPLAEIRLSLEKADKAIVWRVGGVLRSDGALQLSSIPRPACLALPSFARSSPSSQA